MQTSIQYWNRRSQQLEIEKVYGDSWVRWLYETKLGIRLSEHVLSRAWLSKLYGITQNTGLSAKKIDSFIKNFDIPIDQYETKNFKSFNDFFIRKFKPGLRKFPESFGELGAPAEGRYFAFEKVTDNDSLPVKGLRLSPSILLGSKKAAEPFLGGPGLIARLCPVDYHRYHYPDDGQTLQYFSLHGQLHSVNPHALKYRGDILVTNERRVALLDTINFGKLAYVEVGALCVGKIVQSHDESTAFSRGQEKGYFLFGGSTVVLLGEPGKWTPDQDLISRTAEGIESLVCLGERLGQKKI